MDTRLEDALASLIERLDVTGDFVVAEAPEVVRQMLQYDTLVATIIVVALSVCLALTVVISGIFLFRALAGYTDDKEFNAGLAAVIGGGISAICIVGIIEFSLKLYKITETPKWYVVEKFSSLL